MIANRKISLGFLIAAFFLVSGRASAAPLCPATPQVYVSSGSQILCVDATTPGAPTMLLSNSTGGSFGDIAFGPDGLLYFTDVLSSTVLRIDPKSSTLLTSATLVATIPPGNTINGLAFSSSNGSTNGDLYVNSNAGVWLIARVACVGVIGCPASLPITPTEAITFSSPITAGGLAFDVPSNAGETMTIVDLSGNILQSAFPFTSATSLASVSKIGTGIFANFCDEALVARGKEIDRLSNGNLVKYVGLGATVLYFEVAADNTIFVATANDVSRVDAAKDPNSGVPSCSATPTPPTVTQLASLSGANGVAIGPTSITITENFSPALLSQTYNFGLYRYKVTFDIVYQPFSLSFKAVRSRPADISFGPAFQPNTVPKHFSPLGGFAVQVVTPSPGDLGGIFSCSDTGGIQTAATDYGLCPTDPAAVQMIWIYATDDLGVDPGVALDSADTLFFFPPSAQVYTTDITHDVWNDCTGTSCGTGTKTITLNSTYLVDNQGLVQSLTPTIQSPVASCGPTTSPTCNPQFKIGSNVDFKITFAPPGPSPSLNLIVRLSIAQVFLASDGTVQLGPSINPFVNVFSKNNSNVDNLFSCSTSLNRCEYNWDSSGAEALQFPAGLYQATIFSNSFEPPLLVYLTLK